MTSRPGIVERPEQPYVGIRGTVTMQTIAQIADRLPDVFGWLGTCGIVPAGAPFFRYLRIDMDRELEIEVGVPVAAPVPGEGDVRPGVLPAGRYANVTHTGHPNELLGVTAELLAWADAEGLAWDREDSPEGERWGARLEVYHTDPRDEPDLTKWETELLFRLAD